MTNTATADVTDRIAQVFAAQVENQWNVKATNAAERKAKLARLKSAVEAHTDEIIAAVLADTRKPEQEIRVTEVLNVLGNIQRNIDNLDDWMQPTVVTPSLNPADKAMIIPEARGVCLILGPWNFPLGLALGPLAAAVAAGNCCIVKLTDLCPNTARVAGKIIRDAFDENEVALFEGEVEVAQALLELPFNHIFFTGSTRVGKIVMEAAAKHLATVTLELGGKSPVIVDASADLAKVAADLAHAKQFNGGQACICPDYVFVRQDQKAPLIEAFQQKVHENLYSEEGAIRKESIAQIVNPANFRRVKAMVDDALGKGAAVAVGGTLEEGDLTVHPTLLTDVTPDMKILQEEIFAPVLPIMTYETLDEVISYINRRDKPLALYIYSQNQDAIDRILGHTSSGGVTINGVFSPSKTSSPSAASTRAAWAATTAISGSRRFRTTARCTSTRCRRSCPTVAEIGGKRDELVQFHRRAGSHILRQVAVQADHRAFAARVGDVAVIAAHLHAALDFGHVGEVLP